MAAIPLVTRIHEWLADRVSWIQYPNVRLLPLHAPRCWRDLSGKQRAWAWFGIAWACVIAFSIYGNLIN